jgi:multiple RNA-binding domain-containing protein 1
VKIIKKNGLSQGYGFIEFKSHEFALKALKLYQNSLFDDHILKLSVSKQSNKEKQKSLKRKRENFEPNNKIVVRNIAFEATSEDIKELFKTYGDIKMVRLPKKMNKQHRLAFYYFLGYFQ